MNWHFGDIGNMIGWLIKKYLQKNLKIRLQYWPMSEMIEVHLELDGKLISSSFIRAKIDIK